MKIGILTHYKANNQGAVLQLLSMVHFLADLGHEPVLLCYEDDYSFQPDEKKRYSTSLLHFGFYLREYLLKKGFGLTLFNTRKALTLKKELSGLNRLSFDTHDVDAIIVGSDEVFSIDCGCDRMMYGYGLHAPAIAYAPSFGLSTSELLKEFKVYDLIKDGLSKMYRLSARDVHTQALIQEMTGREIPLVCDPVILYSGEAFDVPVKIRQKYMLVYSYDRNMVEKSEIDAVRAYAKKHGLITVSCGSYHKWCDKNIVCSAEAWYSYFKDASCVLTDTFHGSVVAMKNHCNLAVFIRQSINANKLHSLLDETNLSQRLLPQISVDHLERVFSESIDYNDVDKRIDQMRENSKAYLLSALDGVGK